MTLPLRARLVAGVVIVVVSVTISAPVVGTMDAFALAPPVAKVLALDLANPAETARNKLVEQCLFYKDFFSFSVFHRMPKYRRVVLAPQGWCQARKR